MRLSEEQVQLALSGFVRNPGWFQLRFRNREEEEKYVAGISSEYYVRMHVHNVTDKEFGYAVSCAMDRLLKFPAIADLLGYVQEHRSRSPINPPLALSAPEGGKCTDFEQKISVPLLCKIGEIAGKLPKSEQEKFWAWWHRAPAAGIEDVLDKLAAGVLSVDQLT